MSHLKQTAFSLITSKQLELDIKRKKGVFCLQLGDAVLMEASGLCAAACQDFLNMP